MHDFVFSNDNDCVALAGELTVDRLKSLLRRGVHTSSVSADDVRWVAAENCGQLQSMRLSCAAFKRIEGAGGVKKDAPKVLFC